MAVRPAAAGMTMLRLRLAAPAHYDLATTCLAHGWCDLAPFSWDEQRRELGFALRLDSRRAVDVDVRQGRAGLTASLRSWQPLSAPDTSLVRGRIVRALDLDTDTAALLRVARAIDPRLARRVRQGAGRRLRAPSLWEDAAKTLFTTNCTWSLTRSMAAAACTRGLAPATPMGRVPFPAPARLARLGVDGLRRELPVGYRARYLHALTRACMPGGALYNIDLSGMNAESARRAVMALPGFGAYASHHLLMLNGFYAAIPIDTVVSAFVRDRHRARDVQAFIDRRYRAWGDYRWWGLWLDRRD